MKKIITSSLLPENIVDELRILGYECVKGFKSPLIDDETAYHPDMLFYKLKSGKLLSSATVENVNKLDTIFSKIEPQGKYPNDCIFNCFFAKNSLICGRSVAEEIVEDAIKANLKISIVRQGYCACSTIKLNDSAFISSDAGIVNALKSTGHDALLVSNDGIKLNGYNNGFIGGCALSINNIVAFTGVIERHKDYKNIKSFSNNFGKTLISLSKDDLYDYGGFIEL